MAEEQQSIFSKLLVKDKEIEDLHLQVKNLQEVKASLEYMLIKSSEQIRKIQEESETQSSNRSESNREIEKLNAEIEFLKKDILITRMNCQSYEKTNNLLDIEIQNMTQYIARLSQTVNNSYHIIHHYQTMEKEKLEIEAKYKKQKKNYKSLKIELSDLQQKIIYADEKHKNKDDKKSADIAQSLQDYISKIEHQKNEYFLLQEKVYGKDKDIKKEKEQCDEQKKNIAELKKQISFLKIENLSLKNKFEQTKNSMMRTNSLNENIREQQQTLKRITPLTKLFNNPRTKSLDNSYHHIQQKYKTEGGDAECSHFQLIQQCKNSNNSLRMNSYSPISKEQKCQSFNCQANEHLKYFKAQNDSSYNLNNTVDLIAQSRFLKQQLLFNKQYMSQPQQYSINQQNNNNKKNELNYCFKKCNTSTSQNSLSLWNNNSNNNNNLNVKQQNCQNFTNSSTNDCTYLLCQHCLSENSKSDILQNNNNCCATHDLINNNQIYQNNQNDSNNIKQILLMVEDIVLNEKIQKRANEQVNCLIEQDLPKESKIILESINSVIKNIPMIQLWPSFNVVLLVQKMKNLIQISLINFHKATQQNKTLQGIIETSNKVSSIITTQNASFLIEKDIPQSARQIINPVDETEAEYVQRSKKISLNQNPIQLIKQINEISQIKEIDETILIEKLNNHIDQNSTIQRIEQDEIKSLLTELQELNQSVDYNQISKLFISRSRSSNKEKGQKLKSLVGEVKSNEQNSQKLNSIIMNTTNKSDSTKNIDRLDKLRISDKVQKIMKCEMTTQTEQIYQDCKEQSKNDENENLIQINKGEKDSSYIERLKKQMQQQFTKKVKDLEQVLFIIKNILNDEKENKNDDKNITQSQKNLSDSLNKLYISNPNLKPFLQNFIEKINNLKSSNQQLQNELYKYQLSNKHIKSLR